MREAPIAALASKYGIHATVILIVRKKEVIASIEDGASGKDEKNEQKRPFMEVTK